MDQAFQSLSIVDAVKGSPVHMEAFEDMLKIIQGKIDAGHASLFSMTQNMTLRGLAEICNHYADQVAGIDIEAAGCFRSAARVLKVLAVVTSDQVIMKDAGGLH